MLSRDCTHCSLTRRVTSHLPHGVEPCPALPWMLSDLSAQPLGQPECLSPVPHWSQMTSAQLWDFEPEAKGTGRKQRSWRSPVLWLVSGCGACVSGSYFFRREFQKGNCCSLRPWTRFADGQRAGPAAHVPTGEVPRTDPGTRQHCPPGASYFEPL